MRRAEQTARLLDSSIRVPGTSRTFGLDAVLGLVPGIGDSVGLVASVVVIGQAIRAGARPMTVVHMLLVALADALLGTIPVLGTASDFVLKANERNVAMLRAAASDPHEAARRSGKVVALTIAGVLVAAIAVAALGLWLFGQLLSLVF